MSIARHDPDEERRIALLNFYSSQLRHWATLLLSVSVASVAIFTEYLYPILIQYRLLPFVIGFSVSQGFYAFMRFLWYGLLLRKVDVAKPRLVGVGGLEPNEIDTPLYRLEAGIQDSIRGKRGGEFLYGMHGLTAWLKCTLVVTLSVSLTILVIWIIS